MNLAVSSTIRMTRTQMAVPPQEGKHSNQETIDELPSLLWDGKDGKAKGGATRPVRPSVDNSKRDT